jgi:two-component system sensor histidine kinase/response regulator
MVQRGSSTECPGEGNRIVLIVDDDGEVRGALAEGLSGRGYDVWTANDGIDAFDTVGRRGKPDAVILDLSMPGMNGWEFLEELREDPELCEVPVLVLTAFPRSKVPDADVFLIKPATLEQIVSALAEEMSDRPEGQN